MFGWEAFVVSSSTTNKHFPIVAPSAAIALMRFRNSTEKGGGGKRKAQRYQECAQGQPKAHNLVMHARRSAKRRRTLFMQPFSCAHLWHISSTPDAQCALLRSGGENLTVRRLSHRRLRRAGHRLASTQAARRLCNGRLACVCEWCRPGRVKWMPAVSRLPGSVECCQEWSRPPST